MEEAKRVQSEAEVFVREAVKVITNLKPKRKTRKSMRARLRLVQGDRRVSQFLQKHQELDENKYIEDDKIKYILNKTIS